MHDLHLKLDSFHRLFQIQPRCIDLVKDLMISVLRNPIPQEVIMITLELHDLNSGVCEIIASLSEDHRHLGRREKYDKCIFSHYSSSIDRTVIIERVKAQPGYLALDDRVMSEVFFEYTFSDSINLILNTEFSTPTISDTLKNWFESVCGIFVEEENSTNINTTDNQEKEH